MARLKEQYVNEIAPALNKKFGYKSVMQIPKLDKIVINVGAGEAKDNAKVIDSISGDLAKITGQKPIVCRAKKSVANFKLREGMNIGAKVTLRGERMYEFMDKLMNIALPRVRDFHGVSAKFDRGGNYNLGIVEQSIFPELSFEETQVAHGLQVTFVVKSQHKDHSRALLEKFKMPFEKKGGE